MSNLIELNRKHDLTVDEVFGLAQRKECEEIVVIGFRGDDGISVWVSENLETDRAHWLVAKAEKAILENS